MRRAVFIVTILLLAPWPLVDAEGETVHLWSEQAPGPVLLWDDSGNLTSVDPNQPIDLHLPEGNWTFAKDLGLVHYEGSDYTLNLVAPW